MSLWVAVLRISPRTAAKLRQKHNLDPREVRAAVVGQSGLRYVWNDHPQRGRRAIIEATIGNEPVLVVLYPVSIGSIEGTFNLGSAYRAQRMR